MPDLPSKQSAFDFAREKAKIDYLISQWTDEEGATTFRRDVRKKEVNVSEEVMRGSIPADGTFIARRVIDQNIRLEKPELAAYLEQSPRTVLFKSLSDPTRDTIPLADWFTLGVRYQGWAEPWHRLIDATCLHGAAAIEIRYNKKRPFNLELAYTPREALIIPTKLRRSIQKCEMIIRVYEYLPNELEDAVEEFGFSKSVVDFLTQNVKEKDRSTPIKVYKIFRKRKGIVYIGWYSRDSNEMGWLKEPEPLTFGLADPDTLAPSPITFFPFVYYLYEYTEEEEPLKVKGRASKDLADQDALSQLWTGLVNGVNKAVNIHGSYKNDPMNPEGGESKPIAPNAILSKEVEFWQAQYPDPMILAVAQSLSSTNMQSAGKVDYAAQNRVDSRKTATEINSARDQSMRLSSINVIPLAAAITEVYTHLWSLVQAQVLISLNLPPEAQLIPVPSHIDPINWTDNYELSPAGDVEVIKRAEKLANLQQDLPLFQGTPLYNSLLVKYLELRFPDEAMRWKAELQAPNLGDVVGQLMSVIAAVPVDTFTPEQQQQITAIMQNASTAVSLQTGSQSMASGPSNQSPSPAPQGPGGESLSPSTSPIKNTING